MKCNCGTKMILEDDLSCGLCWICRAMNKPYPVDPPSSEAIDHEHNSYTCFPHVEGCDCSDLQGTMCNPYYDPATCPLE